jgi:hypothetical protein
VEEEKQQQEEELLILATPLLLNRKCFLVLALLLKEEGQHLQQMVGNPSQRALMPFFIPSNIPRPWLHAWNA